MGRCHIPIRWSSSVRELSGFLVVPSFGNIHTAVCGIFFWGTWEWPALTNQLIKTLHKAYRMFFSTWHWQVTGNRVALGPKSVQCSCSGSGQVSKSIAGRYDSASRTLPKLQIWIKADFRGSLHFPWATVPRLPTSCHTRLSSRISSFKLSGYWISSCWLQVMGQNPCLNSITSSHIVSYNMDEIIILYNIIYILWGCPKMVIHQKIVGL